VTWFFCDYRVRMTLFVVIFWLQYVYLAFESQFNRFVPLYPPPCTISMDNLICIGCARLFNTQRSLRGHEARCQARKALTADIYRQHRSNNKSKKWKRTRTSPSNSPEHTGNLRFVEIDDAEFQPEVCVVTREYEITAIGEYRNHYLMPL
jgi:hypothetical protein